MDFEKNAKKLEKEYKNRNIFFKRKRKKEKEKRRIIKTEKIRKELIIKKKIIEHKKAEEWIKEISEDTINNIIIKETGPLGFKMKQEIDKKNAKKRVMLLKRKYALLRAKKKLELWICSNCTFKNDVKENECIICHKTKL